MKAIILGGTSGIGKSIVNRLEKVCDKVIGVGRKDVDTTSLISVRNFAKKNHGVDVLVLNTGGPPDLKVSDISDEIWLENFNKLFLSFLTLTKEIGLKNDGYVFLISSFITKQPGKELIISSSLRAGFINLFKSLSKIYEEKKICFINLAPGPMKTKRLVNLLKKDNISIEEHAKTMPGKHIPDPNEIGLFVEFVVKNKIKSLNGVTIPFDSGLLEGI
jgi:3-oxoacyl-[acyl-carrier protein] reductase|tara:strand:- start:3299 stop:3952 length:654 start_codon:yes stop_codon:yes gene_type:complete